jgi:hypothetical protein
VPSLALQRWQGERAAQLQSVRDAHTAFEGGGRGRRYRTQQLNQAFALMVSGQFQGFCRDLHTEAADHITGAAAAAGLTPAVQLAMSRAFTLARKLDSGNPNPGNIGADFGRFVASFWAEVQKSSTYGARRQARLEALNQWRNAIAHQNFDPSKLGGRTELTLHDVDQWRSCCSGLAVTFDTVVRQTLRNLLGANPW